MHTASVRRVRDVPIHRVLALRGVSLTRRGDRLVGPCPVHGGDSPAAFVVHPARNLWYCFSGCARGGDVIDLVRLLDHSSFSDALRALERVVASGGPPAPLEQPPAPAIPWKPYTRRLPLDSNDPWLLRKGILPTTARRFEMGRYHGPGFLAGCVGVRLHDPAGRPIGYTGRRLDAEDALRHGKWKLPPGLPKGSLLYALHHGTRRAPGSPLVLVECPWGVLRLAQLDLPAVALLGTTLTAGQIQALGAPRPVALLLDGDTTGRSASLRLAPALRASGHTVTILTLPDGTDPDDLSDPDLAAVVAPWRPRP